jgi:hypothetical protein
MERTTKVSRDDFLLRPIQRGHRFFVASGFNNVSSTGILT